MPPKRRNREPKVKTKTFTGCWTCRVRKVKCDAFRPHCQRCSNARLRCEGYGIKLYWIAQGEAENISIIKRQAMSLIDLAPRIISEASLEQYLADIEDTPILHSSETAVAGLFGVFESRHTLDHSGEDDSASTSNTTSTEDVLPNARIPDQDLLYEDVPPSLNLKQLYPVDDLTTSFVDESGESRRISINQFISTSFCKGIYRSSLITRLMDHYMQNVTNVLQPIVHRRSTYNSIYVPEALSGYQKFLINLSGQDSKVLALKIAILFSLLSTSAFHLRGTDITMMFQEIGVDLRMRAQKHLRKSIEICSVHKPQLAQLTQIDAIQLETTLSVILTLVTVDIMDGLMSEFWIHLEGARQICRQLRSTINVRPNLEVLLNTCRFLTILSETTWVTLPTLPWTGCLGTIPEDEDFSGVGHGLVYTYGVTIRLTRIIHRTTLLSRHIAYYISIGQPFPASLMEECQRLCATLGQWTVESEDLSSITDDDPRTLFLLEKHLLAFASGIQIYFHARVVPCTSVEMKDLVLRVAEHLNDIEDTKKRTGYNVIMTASVTWPGFMASCEADPEDREIWHAWWNAMLQYGIGNIAHLWSIVQEAWKLRDEGLRETPAWLPVLQRTARRILAI